MQRLRGILLNPDGENRDFRCDICNKYLSVAPIHFHETVGKVCGRCVNKGETTKFTDVSFGIQTVYEGIARHIDYPCSFQAKGCTAKLGWGQVTEHEDSCEYRTNKCPFGRDGINLEEKMCDWYGDNTEFFPHLKDKHNGYFNKNLKIMVAGYTNPKNNLIISYYMDIPVVAILFVREDLKTMFFHLLMDTPFLQCKDYTYDLEVSDAAGKNIMVFPGNKVGPICEKALTANCLGKGFSIDINGLFNFFKNMDFHFWFKIQSKELHLIKEEPDSSLNTEMIFKNKCQTCGKILQDPIYLCKSAHNICGACYDTKSCCECENRITKGRNETLEDLSRISLYECKNKDKGCSKLIKSKQFAFHEANCELTVKDCVMKCQWSGNNFDMLKHVIDAHPTINMNEDYLYDGSQKNFCAVLNRKIFLICIDYKLNEHLSINFQYLGALTPKSRFEFVLMSGKLELKCSHYCHPLLYGSEQLSKAIIYPFDCLKQFLTDQNQFHFKVNILE